MITRLQKVDLFKESFVVLGAWFVGTQFHIDFMSLLNVSPPQADSTELARVIFDGISSIISKLPGGILAWFAVYKGYKEIKKSK